MPDVHGSRQRPHGSPNLLFMGDICDKGAGCRGGEGHAQPSVALTRRNRVNDDTSGITATEQPMIISPAAIWTRLS